MYTDAYPDAVRPEQVEKAISAAVIARFNSPHLSLEDCVASAVERVFCPCVSHVESERPPRSIGAGIADMIVHYLRQGFGVAGTERQAPHAERRHDARATGKRLMEREGEANRDTVLDVIDRKRRQDDALDDALAQTFPASDPVAQQIFN